MKFWWNQTFRGTRISVFSFRLWPCDLLSAEERLPPVSSGRFLWAHTVCWGPWWAAPTAATWRQQTGSVETWSLPSGWAQTASRGPGCRMEVGRTSSRTWLRPNPTSPPLAHSHCPPEPDEKDVTCILSTLSRGNYSFQHKLLRQFHTRISRENLVYRLWT